MLNAMMPPMRSQRPKRYWWVPIFPTVTPSGSGPFERLRLSFVLLVLLALKFDGYVAAVFCSRKSPESHTRAPAAFQMEKLRPPSETIRSQSPSPSRSPRSLRAWSRPSRALFFSQSAPGNTCLSRFAAPTARRSRNGPNSRESPSFAVTKNDSPFDENAAIASGIYAPSTGQLLMAIRLS